MNVPVVVPLAAVQFVVGFVVVPQQVPRADIDAGYPREVTLAPRVAPVVVIEVSVGVVTVGATLTAHVLPFQVVPDVQLDATATESS